MINTKTEKKGDGKTKVLSKKIEYKNIVKWDDKIKIVWTY